MTIWASEQKRRIVSADCLVGPSVCVCVCQGVCVFVCQAGVCGGRQIGPEALQVFEVKKEEEAFKDGQTGRKTDGRLFTLLSDSNCLEDRETLRIPLAFRIPLASGSHGPQDPISSLKTNLTQSRLVVSVCFQADVECLCVTCTTTDGSSWWPSVTQAVKMHMYVKYILGQMLLLVVNSHFVFSEGNSEFLKEHQTHPGGI